MTLGKTIASLGAAAALAFGATEASATIVDISALSSTGTSLSLGAGTYSFSFIGTAQGGAYDAASLWSTTTGCDKGGANCSRGWMTALFIDFGNALGAFDRTNGLAYWQNSADIPLYSTPEAANAAAQSSAFWQTTLVGSPTVLTAAPFSFTLSSARTVNFLVPDSSYGDNRGGISLNLNTAAVPEPATWAMLLAGFGAVGFAMRRTRAHKVAVSFA